MKLFRIISSISTIVALLLFVKGFLPLKQHIDGHGVDKCCSKAAFSKVVVFVVDALKTNFVIENRADNWPYLDQLVRERHAKIYNARVHPPTVTLPRIKALISGDIPGFVDVIMNFDSAELKSDNLLYQLSAAGLDSVFYGDDTWLKLFPHTFLRSEGTTSFFVSDYIEVDNNVTRHLPTELREEDWSLMILHYLGLDHIGHLIGPSSSLVPPKLREMDAILEQIHTSLMEKDPSDYLIILCGDHGMADQGGHGGVTPNEVSTPLVFVTNQLLSDSEKLEDIYQIDLVPTLSSLMNVPIPQNSLGIAIPSLLRSLLSPKDILATFELNMKQLMKLAHSSSSASQNDKVTTRQHMIRTQAMLFLNSSNPPPARMEKLLNDYSDLMLGVRENLAAQLVDYDVTAMLAGFSVLITVLICHVCVSKLRYDSTFLTTTLVISSISLPVYYTHCSNIAASNALCTGALGPMVLVLQTLMLTAIACSVIYTAHNIKISVFCVAVLHSLSLLASSFIEEEHQTAYFFTSTLLCIALFYTLTQRAPRRDALCIIATLACTTVARKWNQTGDKWAHLSDIADTLNMLEYTRVRILLAMISIPFAAAISARSTSRLSKFVTTISTLSTMLFVLQDSGYVTLSDRGVYEALTVYICCALILLYSSLQLYRQERQSALSHIRLLWVLLNLLLHRTVNLPIIAALSLVEYLLSRVRMNLNLRILLYYWIGQAAFYYQGNSNSLSTIDISAGYKGMTSYNPAVTASLMLFNTYSGPIYWILNICTHLLQYQGTRQREISIDSTLWLYLLFKLLDMVTLLFLIILERYHLFVWTVFAPKLLYELTSLTIFLVIFSISTVL